MVFLWFSHVFSYENDLFTWTNYTNIPRVAALAPLHLQPGAAMAMAGHQPVTQRTADAQGGAQRGTRGALGPRWRYPRILAGKGSWLMDG